jgi:hypothetical protein
MDAFNSIPDVLETTIFRGKNSDPAAAPDLLIEIAHGATRTRDYAAVEAKLTSPLPASLSDFFHVNTDAGAPELGMAIARAFVEREPARSAAVLRCLIPRTFIDCNRRIDAAPEEFRAGKVTPGLMPWITSEADRAFLRGRYDFYTAAVRAAAERVLPRGLMLLLHTYAPRTVGVEVDLQIVESLHRAYQPEVEPTWPLRPEIDLIHRDTEGGSHAPAELLNTLKTSFGALGIDVADSATYPMHPSTLAWAYATRWPARVFCVEVRRDLLADPFTPFVEMKIGPEKVERMAVPFVDTIRRCFSTSS